jgi:aspartate kinase
MSKPIVSKFGGSSTANPGCVDAIKGMVEENPARKIIVVSAHGKRDEKDTKDTDLLIELAKTKEPSVRRKIIGRAREIHPEINEKIFDSLNINLTKRVRSNLEGRAYRDNIEAFGEFAAAKLYAASLGFKFIDSANLFRMSSEFGAAKALPETEDLIRRELENLKEPVVIGGYYGSTEDGLLAVFDRGGSDITGAIVTAATDAEIYENCTDRDGISAADPRLVESPRRIDRITYDEFADLAPGFSIFHADAVDPVRRRNIPVHVRNTFDLKGKGTYIVGGRIVKEGESPVVGVSYVGNHSAFKVQSRGLDDAVGILYRSAEAFARREIPIADTPMGLEDMTFGIDNKHLEDPLEVGQIYRDLHKIAASVSDCPELEIQQVGRLIVSGKGLKGRRGIAGRIQDTLASAGVNLVYISQGATERCVVYGINPEDSKKAVNAVHDRYLAEE